MKKKNPERVVKCTVLAMMLVMILKARKKLQCFSCHPRANITIYGPYNIFYLNSWEI